MENFCWTKETGDRKADLALYPSKMTGTCFDPSTNAFFSVTCKFSEDGRRISLFIQDSKNKACLVVKLVPWKDFITLFSLQNQLQFLEIDVDLENTDK